MLILMSGLPYTGKTTYAHNLDIPVVSLGKSLEPNFWRDAKKKVKALFEEGHDEVVVDGPNNTKELRSWWRTGDWEVKIAYGHCMFQHALFMIRWKKRPGTRPHPQLDKLAKILNQEG